MIVTSAPPRRGRPLPSDADGFLCVVEADSIAVAAAAVWDWG